MAQLLHYNDYMWKMSKSWAASRGFLNMARKSSFEEMSSENLLT